MRLSTLVYTLWGVAAAIALAGELAYTAGWRINHTTSLPPGLWRVHPIDRPIIRGDIVSLCPPDTPVFRQARRRGYIGGGRCPGGYEPLMKPVAAIAGDRIDIGGDGIAVNGRLLTNSAARRHDSRGRRLTPLGQGTRTAAPGEVWLISDYSPASFDSRYFGPISIRQVSGFVTR